MATYIPLTDLPMQYQDSVTSENMANGTLEFYLAGTSNETSLFSDDAGTSIGASITLNSGGYPEAGGNIITLFRDRSIPLKVVLKNAAGAEVWTMDDIPAVASFDSTASDKLDGIEAGADVTDEDNVGDVVNGLQETPLIPAESMYLPSTNPAGALATVEGTAGMPNYRGFPFDGTSAEYVELAYAFPKRWDRGTVTAVLYWTSSATDTDGVTWNARARALSDSDPFAASYGTPVSIDDTLLGAAGDLHIVTSGAITIGGSPADNDLIIFRIGRDPDNANDDAAEDAVLVGVKFKYTSDALNDA